MLKPDMCYAVTRNVLCHMAEHFVQVCTEQILCIKFLCSVNKYNDILKVNNSIAN